VHRLIVNADDFGQTSGINRAVLELHQAGVLTSATMMANAAATAEAIEIARAMPALGIGCHIVLTDGAPILRPDQVPSLLDGSSGHFIPSLNVFLARLFMGKIRSAEIQAEATAQIQHLQFRGIRVDHVDTHKHIHMFPRVLRPILRAARACGIGTVRNPFEPRWAVRATAGASFTRMAQVNLLRRLRPAWHADLSAEGFATTDGTIGVTATGVLDAANLQRLVSKAPAGTWELVTHPGFSDADLAKIHTALRASRDIERQALYGVRESAVFDLISYSDLKQSGE
jgi:hopanoid biosynthesis associated protein HpnK